MQTRLPAHQRPALRATPSPLLLQNPLSWPERVCNAIWGSPEAGPEARAAAVKLGYGDYLDMVPEDRLKVGPASL